MHACQSRGLSKLTSSQTAFSLIFIDADTIGPDGPEACNTHLPYSTAIVQKGVMHYRLSKGADCQSNSLCYTAAEGKFNETAAGACSLITLVAAGHGGKPFKAKSEPWQRYLVPMFAGALSRAHPLRSRIRGFITHFVTYSAPPRCSHTPLALLLPVIDSVVVVLPTASTQLLWTYLRQTTAD